MSTRSQSNIKTAGEFHQSLESPGNTELRDPGRKEKKGKGEKYASIYSSALPILALSHLTTPSPPGSPYWTPDYSPKPSPKLTPEESPVLSSDGGGLGGFSDVLQPPRSETSNDPSQYLPTSCSAIDTALHGGFTYHIVNSLSSEYSTERTLIAMHAVVTHLLSHADAKAVWVDTEGTFSAIQLRTVVVSRVEGLEMAAEGVLDRVQVARVFDMQGLVEVLGELKATHEEREDEWKVESESEVKELGDVNEGIVNDSQDDSGDEEGGGKGGGVKEKVINDSQEDEEDWEDDEGDEEGKKQGDSEEEVEDGTGMDVVVVDTITHLLSEMKFINQRRPKDLQKDPFEAEDNWHEMDKPEGAISHSFPSHVHSPGSSSIPLTLLRPATALFIDFCRSFSLIARNQKICLLLLNDTTPIPDDEDPYVRSHELFPSQFHAFSETKPSLGPVYTEYIDLSVLLTKQPRGLSIVPEERTNYVSPNFVNPEGIKPLDGFAELEGRMAVIGGDGGDGGDGYREEWVAEVVGDRYGDRVGEWGAFGVEGVKLVDILWDDGGN